SRAERQARAMSSTCTSGRQGEPSLCKRTSPLVYAVPVRLLTTMSARSRGDEPYAVAFSRYVGMKLSSANLARPASTSTLLSPYGVTGLNVAISLTGASPAAPYNEQEEENRYRGTPAAFATSARCTAP